MCYIDMLKIAIYVSNHGYGHASRMAALAEEFTYIGIQVCIRSARPDFLFPCLNSPLCHKDEVQTDFGIIHTEGLQVDIDSTREALMSLMANRSSIVEKEVQWLRKQHIDLAIVDIPFLVIEACSYAKVPVIAVTNFEWAFTYEYLFKDNPQITPVINVIHSLYKRCDASVVLPLSSQKSLAALAHVRPSGLLARKKEEYPRLREMYDLEPGSKILACTFGGESGLSVEMKHICEAYPGVVFSNDPSCNAPNHIFYPKDNDWLDLLHDADLVLCKPGYSTFAEVLQFNKPLVCFPGSTNPETHVLIEGLASYPHKLVLECIPQNVDKWKAVFASMPPQAAALDIYQNQNSKVAADVLNAYLEVIEKNKSLEAVLDIGSNYLNFILMDSRSPKVIHAAHFNTGLAKDFSTERILNFKKTAQQLLCIVRGQKIKLQLISTSIARDNPRFEEIRAWFKEMFALEVKILSQKQEARLAYLAAQKSLDSQQELIVADIGGMSTEIIWGLGASQWQGLDLGLLKLRADSAPLQPSKLPDIPGYQNKRLVLVGLTGIYYAAMILRLEEFFPWDLHNKVISRSQIEELDHALKNNEQERWEPYLQAGADESILRASHALVSLLLDKYQPADIVVCYYGISFAYPHRKDQSKR